MIPGVRQLWSGLIGRSRLLLTLAEVEDACTVDGCRYVGKQTVAIDRIQGSQERGCDFDCDFNPLQDHNEERWLGIARARRLGKALPPVDLVQVGDIYFVQDGHHRVSVARALGLSSIEAKVTVWQVSGVLPWERAAHTSSPAGQEMGIRQLFGQVRDHSIRLQQRFLLRFRDLLSGFGVRLIEGLVAIGPSRWNIYQEV